MVEHAGDDGVLIQHDANHHLQIFSRNASAAFLRIDIHRFL
jgi:hypothetical protein